MEEFAACRTGKDIGFEAQSPKISAKRFKQSCMSHFVKSKAKFEKKMEEEDVKAQF